MQRFQPAIHGQPPPAKPALLCPRWMAAGVLVFCFVLIAGCRPQRASRLHAIGEYFVAHSIAGSVSSLANSRTAPDVVRVGPTLPAVLAGMQSELRDAYSIETQLGDAFGEGGDVTHSIIIRTRHDAICLRMRYDSSLDRFHIVGYGAPQK